ncbi:MAG: ChaN family lipoprotein [Gammaproteobacteria bacterium]|nr:ChaN family lipoprotein [Gammaproteobacteria bacterium]
MRVGDTFKHGNWRALLLAVGVLLTTGCQTRPDESADPAPIAGHGHASLANATALPPDDAELAATPAIDLRAATDVTGLVDRLVDTRVVYLGEQHDRYEQHLLQAAVIRGLRERGVPLAIGMEQFQRRFQPALDDFIAGRIDTTGLLRQSEYYQRWRFDFRLYQPILDYARKHGIPVLALNAEAELTRRVGKVGLGGLSAEERNRLPLEYGEADASYRAVLQRVFSAHASGPERNFEHFVDVQLSWDETMAETAANYLLANPDRHLVVLVGAGHVVERHGIPNRVRRRLPVTDSVVLMGETGDVGSDRADWMLLPLPAELPPSGKMGILMEDSEQGVRVVEAMKNSAAAVAGVNAGDIMTEIDGQALATTGDVRTALFAKRPGDTVTLTVHGAEDEVLRTLPLVLKAH